MNKASRIIPEIQLKLISTPQVPTSDLYEIKTSKDVEKLLREEWDGFEVYESFKIVLISRNLKVLGLKTLTNMSVSNVQVDISAILKLALLTNASSVIIAHNHPSGNLKPSVADRNLTKLVKDALKMVNIELLDHLILTDIGIYSFANENEI